MIPNGFHGYSVHLGAQLIGTAAAIVYGLTAATIVFTVIDRVIGLRVSEAEELSGLDIAAHGMAAYPELALAASAASDSARRAPLHVLSGVRVSEVMTEVPAISPLDSLDAVQEIMFSREVFALPVLDEDEELCGIVSMSDIMKIARPERGNVNVAAVFSREVQSAFPDQTIHEVVERMRERHLANFPVVSRRNDKQLLGMVTKGDIVVAYRSIALETAV